MAVPLSLSVSIPSSHVLIISISQKLTKLTHVYTSILDGYYAIAIECLILAYARYDFLNLWNRLRLNNSISNIIIKRKCIQLIIKPARLQHINEVFVIIFSQVRYNFPIGSCGRICYYLRLENQRYQIISFCVRSVLNFSTFPKWASSNTSMNNKIFATYKN